MTREPCACGCGQYPKKPTSRYMKNHDKRTKGPAAPCACGCGQLAAAGRSYKSGHNSRVAHPSAGHHHTQETKEKISNALQGAKAAAYRHGGSKDHGYSSWLAMRARHRNRGVPMDPRWNNYAAFIADVGPRPDDVPGYSGGDIEWSIDRIDDQRGYFADNCRWATREQQNATRTDPGGWKSRREGRNWR